MRDPEPCRIKHTEDTEQQTGWCLFFSLLIVLMVITLQADLDCCNRKESLELCNNTAEASNNSRAVANEKLQTALNSKKPK